MFSIICCSINPQAADRLRANIEATCGVPFEFIAYDNRGRSDGLCKVYNACAARARYDMLCFVHEDVEFLTEGWGRIIAAKLAEPDCGVIGFAGSILKLRRLSGWHNGGGDLRAHYVQYMNGRHHTADFNPEGLDFSPVVTLDGLCLFVRRDVWQKTPFDEQTFTGFHGYDIDFTLAVACRCRNYVCNKVMVEHFSTGGYSQQWLDTMKRLHHKWRSRLPIFATPLPKSEIDRYERVSESYFIRFMWQKGCFYERNFGHGVQYIARYPFSGHAWILLPKYVIYKLRALLNKKKGGK